MRRLVRGVLCELPLTHERRLHAVEHGVQRLRQLTQFIVGGRQRQPRVQRVRVDRLGAGDHFGQRSQHTSGSNAPRDQRHNRAGDVQRRQQPDQHFQKFIFAVYAPDHRQRARRPAVQRHIFIGIEFP